MGDARDELIVLLRERNDAVIRYAYCGGHPCLRAPRVFVRVGPLARLARLLLGRAPAYPECRRAAAAVRTP